MKINVSDIKRSHGLSRTLRFEEEVRPEGVELTAPVQADLKLTNVGSRILLEGDLRTRVRQQCSRCAAEFDGPLEVEVEEQFLPHDSPEVPQGEEIEPDQLNVFTYEDDIIEIDEVIRQNLVASLPTKPLCAEDCRGLCYGCGANLNEKSCDCESEESVDPRWGKLRDLQSRVE